MPDQAPDTHRLIAAHRTLVRGSAFLAHSLRARACENGEGGGTIAGPGGAKVVGNGLRELDRFLSLMIDEAACIVAPAGFDKAAFARRRNVADKIRRFHILAGIDPADDARLRAIGRVRDCLHHCRGIVHDAGLHDDLRIAGGGVAERPTADARLAVSFDALSRICGFYAAAGAGLVAACAAPERPRH